MSRLLIRLLPDASYQWTMAGAAGRRGVGLPDASLVQSADTVILLVPSEHVLLLSAPRISPRRDELERGLAFAIEERLAAPIEHLQVAVGDSDSNEQVPALVVDRVRLASWLQDLAKANIAVDAVLPESVLIPVTAGAGLWLDGERFVARNSAFEAVAGQASELTALLALGRIRPTRIWRSGEARLPDSLSAIPTQAVIDALAWLGDGLAHAAGLNLLSGGFAAHRRRHGHDRRIWRWAAALAAAALALTLLHGALELRALQARQVRLNAEMEGLFRSLVPDASRVVDAEAQLASALQRLQGGAAAGGALPLLARIAPALGDVRYSLDLIEYRDGGLELVVRGTDVASLDALREALSKQLQSPVELTSAVPGAGGVEARYRARAGGM